MLIGALLPGPFRKARVDIIDIMLIYNYIYIDIGLFTQAPLNLGR